MNTVIKGGLVWPKTDEICYDCILKDVPFLKEATKFCKEKRTAIQAGGNAGMYPLELNSIFYRVLTFEPEDGNFHCLVENVSCHPSIKPYKGALGNEREGVCLSGWPPNSGAYKVSGKGTIKQYVIDDFNLKDVDFIQLDIQGSELKALYGAVETIERTHPVIMLEEGMVDCVPFLRELGYEEVAATRPAGKSGIRDAVYA